MFSKVLWAGIIAILVLIGGALLFLNASSQPGTSSAYVQKEITLNTARIRVDVADTQGLRELGLSGRSGLTADTGMFFVFPTDGHYSFWMKDMKFAIDMVWIASDEAVVGMFTNVAPDTYPKSFAPDGVARYVLELPAGYVLAHGVKVGDTVGR